MTKTITIETDVYAPIEKVWKCYTEPKHIMKWNHASDDWHSPHAENDLKVGGKFVYRMETKDSSIGFDFNGEYTEVKNHELIAYTIEDGRKVRIVFTSKNDKTHIKITFEAENENSVEMQRHGWQAILDNFKKHCES